MRNNLGFLQIKVPFGFSVTSSWKSILQYQDKSLIEYLTKEMIRRINKGLHGNTISKVFFLDMPYDVSNDDSWFGFVNGITAPDSDVIVLKFVTNTTHDYRIKIDYDDGLDISITIQ